MNVTIDDASPLWHVGGNFWTTNHPQDSNWNSYFQGTYWGSNHTGDIIYITFNGSSIQVFGGCGPAGANYEVQLDNRAVVTGTEQQSVFEAQKSIFSQEGLDPNTEHSLKFTNKGSGNQVDFTLDYAVIQIPIPSGAEVRTDIIPWTDSSFSFSGDGWQRGSQNTDPQASSQSGPSTQNKGDTVTLTFTGSSITVWGYMGQQHGIYTTLFDGWEHQEYGAGYWPLNVPAIVFARSGIDGTVPHTVQFKNTRPGQMAWFNIDHAVVNNTILPVSSSTTSAMSTTSSDAGTAGVLKAITTSSSAASTSSPVLTTRRLTTTSGTTSPLATLSVTGTAGSATVIESPSLDTGSSKSPSSGVIGGVIGASAIAIIALIGLLFWMLRRRKRNEESYENSNRRIVDLNSDYDGDIQTPVMTQTDQAPQQGGGTNSMMRQSSFFQPTQDQYSESGRDTMMPYLRNLSLAPPPPPTDTQSYVPYGRPLVGYREGSTASGLETTDERMETLSPSSELQQDENTANPFVPESTARSPSTKADPSPILTTRTTDSDDTARMHREIDFGLVTSASSTHTLPPDYHQATDSR